MTIAIAVKVYDGIVLATDSALITNTMVGGKPQFLNATGNATKLINLHRGLPVGMVMWGAGSMGNVSVHTLAKGLRRRLMGEDPNHLDWALDPTTYTLEGVSQRVRQYYYEEIYKVARDPSLSLGLWVAGYSAGEEMPELWLTGIDRDQDVVPTVTRSYEECGIDWHGDAVAVPRMILGVGKELFVTLQQTGMNPVQAETAVSQAKSNAQLLLAPPPMPLQDAVDLATFLAETEVGCARFRPGYASTTGPIDIAAITQHEGFTWIRRKPFADRPLNEPWEWPAPEVVAAEPEEPAPVKKKRTRKKKAKKT